MDAKGIEKTKIKCIRGEPAPCMIACSLEVDVREIVRSIQHGLFHKAYRLYHRQTIFPYTLSRICREECTVRCEMVHHGGSCQIRNLEQSCVDFGYRNINYNHARQRREQKVAVYGGGLVEMTCAFQLTKKGFSVTLYEPSKNLGNMVYHRYRDLLEKSRFDREVGSALKGVDVRIDSSRDQIESFLADYDEVYIDDMVDRDVVGKNTSPAAEIARGKLVAESIEASILNIERDPKKSTGTTKPVGTPLKDRFSVPPVDLSVLTERCAIEEAQRCMLCQCDRCMEVCPLMKSYGRYPKEIIDDIGKTLTTVEMISTKVAARQINSCTACGMCEDVCPVDLNMEDIFLSSRRILHRSEELPPALHQFWIDEMNFSNGEASVHQGEESDRYVFFPGCQLGGANPDNVVKTYRYLKDTLLGGVSLNVSCCGVPAMWSGREREFELQMERIKDGWRSKGKPVFILACPTCQKVFSDHLSEITFESLWDTIAKKGLPDGCATGSGTRVYIFDPCSTKYNEGQRVSVRAILSKMGFVVENDATSSMNGCCGYGGLIYGANKDLYDEIVEDETKKSESPYVTYCINCRDSFTKGGKDAWHILDLLFEEDVLETRRKYTLIHERRRNRLRLKESIVGVAPTENNWDGVQLLATASLRKEMDRRLISADIVKRIVWSAETSKRTVLNPRTGSYTAWKKIGLITYWVQYKVREKRKSYELVSVYSHKVTVQQKTLKDDNKAGGNHGS